MWLFLVHSVTCGFYFMLIIVHVVVSDYLLALVIIYLASLHDHILVDEIMVDRYDILDKGC